MFGGLWIFLAVHIWGVIGSLGGVAAVALVVCIACFGLKIGTFLTAITNLLRAGFDFFETPFGEAVGILLLVVAVAFLADIHRTRLDEAHFRGKLQAALNVAARKADQDRRARDDYVTKKVTADAAQRIAQVEAEKADLEQKAKDYETALDASNRTRCTVTGDDLPGRLQH